MVYTRMGFMGGITDVVFTLNNHYSKYLSILFITLLALLSIIGLLKTSNYITNTLLWLVMHNISNYLYATLTAGDYLLNQLLLFNIFFSTSASKSIISDELKNALHNTALIAAKAQICLAYLLAGWFKLTDETWLQGMAVYHTFHLPEYSTAVLQHLPLTVCITLNYFIITYQVLFPCLVWIRSLKTYCLGLGVLQHLVIAFGMGLVSFGIIMMICYLLFLKYDNKV